jgi:hypothetical protein
MSDKNMNIDERRKYLGLMQPRYRDTDRQTKGGLLDEMEAITGLDRKTLIRLMRGSLERQVRQRERGKKYGVAVEAVVKVVYESTDRICAERLQPNLVWLATHLAQHGELELRDDVRQLLGEISVPTLERMLEHVRQDEPRLRRLKPRPGNRMLKDIPMLRLSWAITEPGHCETDLVHHGGSHPVGEYAYTLQMIDVATGWSDRRAVLGRSYLVMEDAFCYMLARHPFRIVEIHPDNGSEFLSHHMLRFWGEIVQGVKLSRSRPFHKNDNPRVEQKNSSLVRAYLGDIRLDNVVQVVALNRIYDKAWIHYNFFQPVMHLSGKEVIESANGATRIKRIYDDASTPFDRLCQTEAILPAHREMLEAMRDSINPRRLLQDIYDALEQLCQLPGATPGVSENVFHTLSRYQEKGEDDIPDFVFNRTPIRK